MVIVSQDNIDKCIKQNVYGCNAGSKARNLKRLFDLKIGDKLIFYSTGISKFIGIFEVSKPFYESTEKIWEDDVYPLRIGIKPVIIPQKDNWLDVKNMINDLEYFTNKTQWSIHFLNNLMPVSESDYNIIKSEMEKAIAKVN